MYAQDGESQKKQEQRILEQRTQQEAEQEQAQIAMNNQHMAIQKKKTRKRMKNSSDWLQERITGTVKTFPGR